MNHRLLEILIILLLVIAVFVPRLSDLDAFRAPDEKRWISNTSSFTSKLAQGKLSQLLQQPHPGITTQWLGSLTVRYDSWQLKKLPLVMGQGLLILIIGYVFGRLWGWPSGAILTILLAFNPMLYAHSRIYAMDSLLALFILLSIGLLLLWRKLGNYHYLMASGFAAAAATLSKLSGIIVAPFIGLLFVYWLYFSQNRRQLAASGAIWLLAFAVSFGIILPSFALAPQNIIGDFSELFRSDEYLEKHFYGPSYYIGSLIFFSTPTQMLALILLPLFLWSAWHKKIWRYKSHHVLIFAALATFFVIQMMLGLKKGDRYILPAFLAIDAIAAVILTWLLHKSFITRERKAWAMLALMCILVGWQAGMVWKLHPHTLAYVNPLTTSFFGDRRHGWGEGLDVAAKYLNEKPDAVNLTVASFYPNEFGAKFIGNTKPAHQHDEPGVDYVILYRAMLQRGDDSWETDVLNQYADETAEKVISFNGIDFVWIYDK